MPTYRITNRITKERAQVELIQEGPFSDLSKRPLVISPRKEGGRDER